MSANSPVAAGRAVTTARERTPYGAPGDVDLRALQLRQGATMLCLQDRQVGFALVQQFLGRSLLPLQFPGPFQAPFGQPDTGLQRADVRFDLPFGDAVIRAVQPDQHAARVDHLADLHRDLIDTRLDLRGDGRVVQADDRRRRRTSSYRSPGP